MKQICGFFTANTSFLRIIEIVDETFRRLRQPNAFRVKVAGEAATLFGRHINILCQDARSGMNRGDRRQHQMHRFSQIRVMRQTVG